MPDFQRSGSDNDQRKRVYTGREQMRCEIWNQHELRGVRRYPQVVPFPHVPVSEF